MLLVQLVSAVGYAGPWLLPDLAAAITLGLPAPEGAPTAIAITAGWSVAFVGVAVRTFKRQAL
jgi:hypothetical protein